MKWTTLAMIAVLSLEIAGCCPAASSSGAVWPRSAGLHGDVERDEPDAWRQDGGISVEPDDPATSSMVEQARLGPPPSPPDDEVTWGEVDGEVDLDDSADLDGDVEITFDPDEMIFDL